MMTFKRLAKLVSRYGIYKQYKSRKSNTVGYEYFYGSDILIDLNNKAFVGTNRESDEWEVDLYSHSYFEYVDYGHTWVIMRKKDITKKYGNVANRLTFIDEVKAQKKREKINHQAWKKRMKAKRKAAKKQKRK